MLPFQMMKMQTTKQPNGNIFTFSTKFTFTKR